MNIFGTLTLVSATILSSESVRGGFHDDVDIDGQQYWRGSYDRFRSDRPHHFGPYKHHGPHYFGPHGPHDFGSHGPHDFGSHGPHHFGSHGPWTHEPPGKRNFHPPHHHYHLPHQACWFKGGPNNRWDWGPHNHPRPPPMTPPNMKPSSEAPPSETIPSEAPPSETPLSETPPSETPLSETPPSVTPPLWTSSAESTRNTPPETKELTDDCVLECLLTINLDDVNTVCGSNGVTYRNAKTLECVKDCGVDVSLDYRGKCKKDEDSSIIEVPASVLPTPQLDSMLLCMISCPVTSEYNPVCGSDGRTYANPGRVECAKICGRDVEIVQKSRCPTNDITSNSNTNTTPTPTSPPLTNAIPKNASPNEDSPLVPSADLPDTDTETSSNSLPEDYTVPQDVLDEIFAFSTEYSELIDVRRNSMFLK